MEPKLGEDAGGVARHMLDLKRELGRMGVEFTDAADDALLHVHASERQPHVDVYTCHGVYTNTKGWQLHANMNVFDNLRAARHVIAVSEWTAAQIRKAVDVDITVIPNGVDLDVMATVKPTKFERPTILWGKTSVSRVLDPAPAIEMALRMPEVDVLTFLSPGTILSAPPNFLQIGKRPYMDALSMLAGANVYLATTVENCPIQLLEALALGVPVAGFDQAGSGEILPNYLCEPGDYDTLHYDVIEALDHGATYAFDAEKYDLRHVAKRTLDVYRMAELERVAEKAGPKVAVVVTCYNKGDYILDTIKSVVAQEGAPPMELVVIDDASTDNSLEQIETGLDLAEASGKFTRTSLISGSDNIGVIEARNTGIWHARAPYIISLDGDDLIRPAYVKSLSAALDSDAYAGIAYSDMSVIKGEWRLGSGPTPEYSLQLLCEKNFIPCAAMFRRKAFDDADGYNPVMSGGWEDYELWLDMGLRGWYGRRVPVPLFDYRKVDDGRDAATHGKHAHLMGLIHRLHRDVFPPTVSVVIPCYEQSKFLMDAIRSVMDQDFTDTEIIVVDDGNGREEESAIAAICRLTGATLVCHAENLGLASARNTGVAAARGKYILPLDADDMLASNGVISEMVAAMAAIDGDGMVYGDWIAYDTETDDREVHEAGPWNADLINRMNIPCTILYPKSVFERVGGYESDMSHLGGWEDWDFILKLIEERLPSVKTHNPVLIYRWHSPEQMRHGANGKRLVLRETLRRRHPELFHKDW